MRILKTLEDRYLQSIDVKMFFFSFDIDFSSKTKFTKLIHLLESPFIDKDKMMMAFYNIQRVVVAINRLKWIWRWRKLKIYNTDDLYMNPVSQTERNVLVLLQNNTKYLFHIRELIHVIQSSLSHCSHFFPDPVDCKNPYTNIPFNKSALYNIYFAVRQSGYSIPPLFEAFFQENFNYKIFSLNYEDLINTEYLRTYVENNCVENIFESVTDMFECHRMRCSIHKLFPSDKLLVIMKPYLEFFYISQYSFSRHKRIRYHRMLHIKLHDFIAYNRQFGRRKVKLVKTNPFSVTGKCEYFFDDNHKPFYTSIPEYTNSHLSTSYTSYTFTNDQPRFVHDDQEEEQQEQEQQEQQQEQQEQQEQQQEQQEQQEQEQEQQEQEQEQQDEDEDDNTIIYIESDEDTLEYSSDELDD